MNNVYTVITSTTEGVLDVCAFGNKKQAQEFFERQTKVFAEYADLNPHLPKIKVSIHKSGIVRNRR